MLAVALFALRNPTSEKADAGPKVTTTPTVRSSSQPTKGATASSTAPTTSPTTASATASTSGTATPGAKLPLVVLNNTSTSGLATQAKMTFAAGGWTVTSTGNLVNNILSTCAYYDPAVPGAQAAAELLRQQFPAIKRTAPKFAELPAGPIVVVLTTDYASS